MSNSADYLDIDDTEFNKLTDNFKTKTTKFTKKNNNLEKEKKEKEEAIFIAHVLETEKEETQLIYAEKINILKEGLKKDILNMKDNNNKTINNKILDEDKFLTIIKN